MATSSSRLEALAGQQFDVVIVGGGISGAWLALHCAQQGFDTALIEKYDYASQTSSSSSKLLHGGIRYLQQMQFNKVRESAMERAEYIYAAPHLSKPVPFVVPTYKDFKRSKLFLNCGMLAYNILCIGQNKIIDSPEQHLPSNYSISPEQLTKITNNSDSSHTGATVFYERHINDSERMVLAILQTAREAGAKIFNYVSATEVILDGNQACGLTAIDNLPNALEENGGQNRQPQSSFSIHSKLIINAAGPWIDELNKSLPLADQAPSINGYAVGSHIITRSISNHAIAITTKHQSDTKIDRGGRHVFVIPWRGYSLIGTSYDEIQKPGQNLNITADQVSQLLDAVNENLPNTKLEAKDLISGYSGLYPLNTQNIKRTVYQGSGEYQIIDHAQANKIGGLITALGAKYTTGRKLSELTMRLAAKKLNKKCKVPRSKLTCSNYDDLSSFTQAKISQYQELLDAETVKHLIEQYGSDIDSVMQCIQDEPYLLEPIWANTRDIMGQIIWAIQHEQTVTLHDMLYNRTSLGLLGINQKTIEKIADTMARLLGWTTEQQQIQLDIVLQKLNHTRQALNGKR